MLSCYDYRMGQYNVLKLLVVNNIPDQNEYMCATIHLKFLMLVTIQIADERLTSVPLFLKMTY